MQRDTIFFQLFQLEPSLVFALLDAPPENARGYRFDSVAVKEAKFTIDGVFLPSMTPGLIFFAEVQFQKDPLLYERLLAESSLYIYRNRILFSDWHYIVIYPNRATEQDDLAPHQHWLGGPKVTRVFLDELGDIQQLPLGVALMVLTTLPETDAPQAARELLSRAQDILPPDDRRGIIEMINTIMVYKFTDLSREEIENMLGTSLQQTRVYQEAKQEGENIGRQAGEAALVLGQLADLVGTLSPAITQQIQALSVPQIEALSRALLRFGQLSDLQAWLQQNAHN